MLIYKYTYLYLPESMKNELLQYNRIDDLRHFNGENIAEEFLSDEYKAYLHKDEINIVIDRRNLRIDYTIIDMFINQFKTWKKTLSGTPINIHIADNKYLNDLPNTFCYNKYKRYYPVVDTMTFKNITDIYMENISIITLSDMMHLVDANQRIDSKKDIGVAFNEIISNIIADEFREILCKDISIRITNQ